MAKLRCGLRKNHKSSTIAQKQAQTNTKSNEETYTDTRIGKKGALTKRTATKFDIGLILPNRPIFHKIFYSALDSKLKSIL